MSKIVLEKDKCIGCGTCAALCPDFWEIEGAKATIKGAQKKDDNREELEKDLNEKELQSNKECQDNCPVACIHIKE